MTQTNNKKTLRVGIAGLGAVGLDVAKRLIAGVPGLTLAAVAVRDVEKHLQVWREDMLSIQRSSVKPPDAVAERFLALTLSNVAGCLVDLKRIWDAGGAPHTHAQVSQQFNCPRCKICTQALKDTIAVLDQTRRSFKSKELAELRKRLQMLLLDVSDPIS
jgi:hypothetical protein